MGTETGQHKFYIQDHPRYGVKLNNPLMGTET